jgi:hypothetical protein
MAIRAREGARVITHFIEASDGVAHGKFLLGRLSKVELAARSALPGFKTHRLMSVGGRRKFNERTTLMLDLQTGEGAGFYLDGEIDARHDMTSRHPKLWVCPMFRPTLYWLAEQGLGNGAGSIAALPHYVEIDIATGVRS